MANDKNKEENKIKFTSIKSPFNPFYSTIPSKQDNKVDLEEVRRNLK